MLELRQNMETAIILITHELEVIKYTCHRMAVMENGKLLEQGLVKDIFRHPQCETAKTLLAFTTNSEAITGRRKRNEFI